MSASWLLIAIMAAAAAATPTPPVKTFTATWDEAAKSWALDGVTAANVTLAVGVPVAFYIPHRGGGGRLWLSFSDSVEETAAALVAEDGVVNNMCDPPCTIEYRPNAADAGQVFAYISDTVHSAGGEILVAACSSVGNEDDEDDDDDEEYKAQTCREVAGCGWHKKSASCVACSSLKTLAACTAAESECRWCLSSSTCVAGTDATCHTFLGAINEREKLVFLMYMLPVPLAGAVFIAGFAMFIAKNSRCRDRARKIDSTALSVILAA